MEQILTVNCQSVLWERIHYFSFNSARKGKLCVTIFSGMWYVLALFDLCILSYLHIYNNGGHVRGVFVHLLSDFMITTKLELVACG